MKLILLLVFISFIGISFICYNKSKVRLSTKNDKVVREKRVTNTAPFDFKARRVLPLKPLRRIPNGKSYRKFVVDREDVDTFHRFASRRGSFIEQLTLKNFDTLDRTKDIWHHRLMKAAHFETRKTIFNFSKPNTSPRLTFDNCYDGWFPFQYFELGGPIERNEIHIKNPTFHCEFHNKTLPKTLHLVDKFGSFAVQIDHNCKWRYWNFDVTNVNVENFDFSLRTDLNFTSSLQVISLKVKGFGSNSTFLNDWLIKKLRLDWIRNVGVNDLVYKSGCLIFEDTDPIGVFHLNGLRQLHYDKENFAKSAPFVINTPTMNCLNFSKKLELFERFGVVAIHILDSCPDSRKVFIIDGRQPFDFVKNREDIKFLTGDTLLYVRIRYMTEKDHLENLDDWFKKIGYYYVVEVGDVDKPATIPEVTISGSISTFMPVPFVKRALRNYEDNPTSRYTTPMIYFRNNSGLDCENRRTVNLLRRSVGKFSASTSRECECGEMTSSDFFWNNCLTHRGTLEITRSPGEQELLRYQNIREIREGQLWIHDTDTVSNLKSLSNLEKVHCKSKQNKVSWKQMSAVRVDAENEILENVDLPKMSKTEDCKQLVTVSGNGKSLPKYSESEWMEKNRRFNWVSIGSKRKVCVAYTGRGGGMSAEFAHQLEGCRVIHGNLNIDGDIDDIPKMTSALGNIEEIQGNVHIKNLKSENCRLLQNVKHIRGNLTYDNNPFLRSISFALLSVEGTIQITRSREFCFEFQETRRLISSFEGNHIVRDCPFYDSSTFAYFEDRLGHIGMMSHLGICFTIAFFVVYMMPEVLWIQLKPLNMSRWREMTELDMRLKLDREAYFDEESSEEEPDIVTWKRKMMMKNRLDGRDIEGEKIQKERRDYRENRRGAKLSQKVKALMRTLREKDSDSEYSGQSWLRRKQKRRIVEDEVNEIEELPFQLMLNTGQTSWVGRSKSIRPEEEKLQRKIRFYEELYELIEEISTDERKDNTHHKWAVLEMLEEHDLLLRSKFVTNYGKIEKFLMYLESNLDRNDTKKWNKLVKLRKKLRMTALEKFGDGEKVKFEEVADDSEHSVKPKRMKAGVYENPKKRKEDGMFAKVIVETLHWKPPAKHRNGPPKNRLEEPDY